MERKHVENGQQQTCLAIRNGLLSFFLLHTKALSANNQYVPLYQDVCSIAAGRTFHYSRTYIPLRQDVLTWQSENVSPAEEKL